MHLTPPLSTEERSFSPPTATRYRRRMADPTPTAQVGRRRRKIQLAIDAERPFSPTNTPLRAPGPAAAQGMS